MNDDDRLLSMTEASQFLGISAGTLLRYLNNDVMPYRRTLGGTKRRGPRRVKLSVLRQARAMMQEGADAETVRAYFAQLKVEAAIATLKGETANG